MSDVPAQLQYTQNHTWVRTCSDGRLEIGITDSAQQALGDLVSVELPKAGRDLKQDEVFAAVESTKTVSDVYAPIAGQVTDINPLLTSGPEAINSDPYGSWLIRVRPAPGALAAAKLLSAAQYQAVLAAEDPPG
jgi:glycine cleavage system H protein